MISPSLACCCGPDKYKSCCNLHLSSTSTCKHTPWQRAIYWPPFIRAWGQSWAWLISIPLQLHTPSLDVDNQHGTISHHTISRSRCCYIPPQHSSCSQSCAGRLVAWSCMYAPGVLVLTSGGAPGGQQAGSASAEDPLQLEHDRPRDLPAGIEKSSTLPLPGFQLLWKHPVSAARKCRCALHKRP
jgi:hypothetical protein